MRPAQTFAASPDDRLTKQAFHWNGTIVAIAASTGGVQAIQQILEQFPADGPPVLIVQHMPSGITALFADRIDRHTLPHVVEARDGMPIAQGMVYVAPGGSCHLDLSDGHVMRCRLVDAPPVNGHRPSGDVLLRSMARLTRGKAIGVILTGMGDDGATALLEMRRSGMHTIAQDEASALIYGMPKAAADCGAVEEMLPLARIGARILELCQC